MTGATYDVEFSSLAAQDAINQLYAALGDINPLLIDIGEYLIIADRQRFKTQTSPDGTPWKPLSPRYQKNKRKNKDRILYLDGYLANRRRYQITDGELQFGSNEPYAAIHHFGGEISVAARMRTLYFKQTKDGVGNKFVKKNKSDFAQDVQGKAYKVKIPARPNLGTSDADLSLIHISLVAELGEGFDDRSGALLAQAVTTLATNVAFQRLQDQPEELDIGDVLKLARTARAAQETRVLSLKERMQIEKNAKEKLLAEQKEKLAAMPVKGGVTEETKQAIREALGIT